MYVYIYIYIICTVIHVYIYMIYCQKTKIAPENGPSQFGIFRLSILNPFSGASYYFQGKSNISTWPGGSWVSE